MMSELTRIERSAEVLLDAGEDMLAAQVLTDFSHRWFTQCLDDCEALSAAAHARLRAAGALNQSDRPMALLAKAKESRNNFASVAPTLTAMRSSLADDAATAPLSAAIVVCARS